MIGVRLHEKLITFIYAVLTLQIALYVVKEDVIFTQLATIHNAHSKNKVFAIIPAHPIIIPVYFLHSRWQL